MSCKVRVIAPEFKKEISAEAGAKLLDVLSEFSSFVHAPCGGRGACGKCLVKAEGCLRPLKPAPEGYVLACQTLIEGDVTVYLSGDSAAILADYEAKGITTDGDDALGLAVDIGTTTLAAYLMDLKNGKVLAAETMLNPQRIHGADVVSRIACALESRENAERLTYEIRRAVMELADRLALKKGIHTDSITRASLVGNTAMMHLVCGYDVKGISAAPFTPAYTLQHTMTINGMETFLGGCVSGYVGADTLGCMLALDFDQTNAVRLLIDIGTNGEIALVKGKSIYACSCAAGPAFEGAHIACGTGAVTGAIDHAKLENGKIAFTTIGGAPASGICGSGLIDLVSALFENGDITSMGRMKNDVYLTDSVYLAREDVREVQLAKSAIASGIQILAEEAGVSIDDIAEVDLAGGFGNYISIPSACAIGLLPPSLSGKIKTVGNAAGEGARMVLCSREARERMLALQKMTRYIELAAHPDFPDLYAENLLFGEDE